jgi:hypothetical protein
MSVGTVTAPRATVTAPRATGNQAPALFLPFEGPSRRTRVLSVSTSLLAVATLTVVNLPWSSWSIDFGPAAITGGSLGGGGAPLRLTFDDGRFTASAIPEPGTYALLAGLAGIGTYALFAGLAALGAAVYRRRSRPR